MPVWTDQLNYGRNTPCVYPTYCGFHCQHFPQMVGKKNLAWIIGLLCSVYLHQATHMLVNVLRQIKGCIWHLYIFTVLTVWCWCCWMEAFDKNDRNNLRKFSSHCVSPSQARDSEDHAQPQVCLHCQDPPHCGTWEHCLQLATGLCMHARSRARHTT